MKLCELEIKIRLESEAHFEKVFALCEQFYGPPKFQVLQRDEYYDSEDGQLKNQDLVLRIRKLNDIQMVALKGPRINLPSGMSKRIELEFPSADGNIVIQQLSDQGLKPYQIQEKERWTFLFENSEILLDKLPFIGYFVEVEGPNEKAIEDIVKRLQLASNEIVQENYGALMRNKFQELGISWDRYQATFKDEKNYIRSCNIACR